MKRRLCALLMACTLVLLCPITSLASSLRDDDWMYGEPWDDWGAGPEVIEDPSIPLDEGFRPSIVLYDCRGQQYREDDDILRAVSGEEVIGELVYLKNPASSIVIDTSGPPENVTSSWWVAQSNDYPRKGYEITDLNGAGAFCWKALARFFAPGLPVFRNDYRTLHFDENGEQIGSARDPLFAPPIEVYGFQGSAPDTADPGRPIKFDLQWIKPDGTPVAVTSAAGKTLLPYSNISAALISAVHADGSAFTEAELQETSQQYDADSMQFMPPEEAAYTWEFTVPERVGVTPVVLTTVVGEVDLPPVEPEPKFCRFNNGGRPTTVSDFLACLPVADGQSASVTMNDAECAQDDLIRTGQTLVIRDAAGETAETQTVVLMGDLSGSGRINIAQLVLAAKALSGQQALEGPFTLAADYTATGSINIADLLFIVTAMNNAGVPEPPSYPAADMQLVQQLAREVNRKRLQEDVPLVPASVQSCYMAYWQALQLSRDWNYTPAQWEEYMQARDEYLPYCGGAFQTAKGPSAQVTALSLLAKLLADDNYYASETATGVGLGIVPMANGGVAAALGLTW